jgi:hypothetical protein
LRGHFLVSVGTPPRPARKKLPFIAGTQRFVINYGYSGMSRTEAFAKAREVVILLAIVEAIGIFIWNTVSLGM